MTPRWTAASLTYFAQYAIPQTFTPYPHCGCLVRVVGGEAKTPVLEATHHCDINCACRKAEKETLWAPRPISLGRI